MEPLVTAICCAYNYAAWLPRALESVLAQGLGPDQLEVIVIDDGSTDDTAEIVKPYLASPLIRYVYKENGGFASAVSRGLDEARGRYICFLDADDAWPPNRLAAQVAFLESHTDIALVYSDMEIIDEVDRVVAPSFMAVHGFQPQSGQLLDRLYLSNFISGGCLMVRSELKHLFHPIPAQIRCQDWWIATQVAAVSEIAFVPGIVYRYRQHGQNMNLGQGDRTGNIRDDFEFRRLILAAPVADRVALSVLLQSAVQIFSTPLEYRQLVTVTEADTERAGRLEAEALRLESLRDLHGAFRTLVRAQAADPIGERRELATRMAAALEQHDSALPGSELRALRVVAFAEELLERPELLDDYAAHFGADDPITLILQIGSADTIERLQEVAGGLEADILAITRPDADVAVAGDVLLSTVEREGPIALLPRFDNAAALRDFVWPRLNRS